MEYLWEECRTGGRRGARILRILGEDGQVEIPETVESAGGEHLPVLELGGYAFSAMLREEPERQVGQETMTAMCGGLAETAALPRTIEKIGRYAFYNCENLHTLIFPASIRDLGAGLFTGCRALQNLEVMETEGKASCLAEVLSELNQTLRVTLRDGSGAVWAKLLIPEYYEESVENTPARILFVETHGCGHRYRYLFRQNPFPFGEYDALFPHVRVQEGPETAAELAWYRLWYPVRLGETARSVYQDFLREHPEAAMTAFQKIGDMRLLREIVGAAGFDGSALAEMALAARRTGQAEAVPLLMDARRDVVLKEEPKKRRRFEL